MKIKRDKWNNPVESDRCQGCSSNRKRQRSETAIRSYESVVLIVTKNARAKSKQKPDSIPLLRLKAEFMACSAKNRNLKCFFGNKLSRKKS